MRRSSVSGRSHDRITLLAISTSTQRGSVSVFVDGRTEEVVHGEPKTHAEWLFDGIDEALAASGAHRSEVSAIACDVGPGSFTGVRVGVAACKGIALALGVPLLPIGSLEAMAWAAFDAGLSPDDAVVAVLDAKRGELFFAAYLWAGGDVAVHAAPSHLRPPDMIAAVRSLEVTGGRSLRIVGDAGALVPDGPALVVPGAAGARAALPTAAAIARMAARRLAGGLAPDAADVEPHYVRPPDARPWDGAKTAR